MVIHCCVIGCKEKFVRGGRYTLHRFPKDEKTRELWREQLGGKDFKVTYHARICSKHFTPDCFDVEKFGGTWLKKNAVPTIFDSYVPPHKSAKRKSKQPECVPDSDSESMSATEEQKVENVIIEEEPVDVAPKEDMLYFGNFSLEDMFYPYKAKRMFKFATAKQQMAYAKMVNLMGKNKKMRKSVNALKRTYRKIKRRARAAAKEEYRKVLKNLYYFADFNLRDMESERKAKEMFHLAIERQKQTNHRVKVLKQRNKRMGKCLASLKEKINRKKSFLTEEECKILEEDATGLLPDNETPSTLLQMPKKRKIEKLLIAMPEPKEITELNLPAIITPDLPGFSEPSTSSYIETATSATEEHSRTIKQESRDLSKYHPDILTTPLEKERDYILPESSKSSDEESPFHQIDLESTIKQEPSDPTDIQLTNSLTNQLSPEFILPCNTDSPFHPGVLIKEEPI